MRVPLLFTEIGIFDVLQNQQSLLKKEIESLSPERIESLPEVELIRELASKYKLEVPVLIEDSAYTSHREIDVDVSHDPMRMIFDRGQPFYIRGTEIVISIPFKGDSNCFRIRPSTYTLNPPRARIQGQEVSILFTRTDSNAVAVKSEYERVVHDIKQHLEWLRTSVEDFNSKIGQQLQTLLGQRKLKIASDAKMIAAIGLPVRKESVRISSSQLRKPDAIQRSIASVKRWDVFISHAGEDKDAIARPLANALTAAGISVWYDEFSLRLGDSLRGSIDYGLANSRFGIVILSKSFFAKNWPAQELNGLFGREVSGTKVILPIWHNIGADEVRQFSPMLADKLAVQSSEGVDKIVAEISRSLEQG